MRRVAQVLIAGVSVLFVTLTSPSSVRVECPFFDIPPATDAAPSAEELFVGTVVENVQGDWFTFRLRIDSVLRGPAVVGEIRTIDHLFPGWPFTGTPNEQGQPVPPCEPIPGRAGNVIAMALGALAPDGVTRYNAASWIAGRLPFNREVTRTTLVELRALAALPPTDTTSVSVVGEVRRHDPLPVLAGVAAALVAVTRRRRPGPAKFRAAAQASLSTTRGAGTDRLVCHPQRLPRGRFRVTYPWAGYLTGCAMAVPSARVGEPLWVGARA